MTDYQRLIRLIRLRIESGDWAPGQKIPSTAKLADEFGLSQSLVNDVMRHLQEQKVIFGIPGSGRFVAVQGNDDDRPVDTGQEEHSDEG